LQKKVISNLATTIKEGHGADLIAKRESDWLEKR